MSTEDAIRETLGESHLDDNDDSNATDALLEIGRAARRVADSITPNICGGTDAAGGYVTSLTEAIMGMTKALVMIAGAIESVASALEQP